jgi:hypothetical protein
VPEWPYDDVGWIDTFLREAGTIPASAAIIGAIENALFGPFGIRVCQQPLTAERIVELIAAARSSAGATYALGFAPK